MNYVVGDFLTRVRNGYLARQEEVNVRKNKLVSEVAKILQNEKYIEDVEKSKDKNTLNLKLIYKNRMPGIDTITIVSKPSLRVYAKKEQVKDLDKSLGTHILSTSKGVMTHKEAMKKNLGGEVICHII